MHNLLNLSIKAQFKYGKESALLWKKLFNKPNFFMIIKCYPIIMKKAHINYLNL